MDIKTNKNRNQRRSSRWAPVETKQPHTRRRKIARNVNPVIPSEKEEISSRSKEKKKKVSLFRKGNAVHFVTIDKIQSGALPRSDLDRGQVSDGSEEPDRNASDPWGWSRWELRRDEDVNERWSGKFCIYIFTQIRKWHLYSSHKIG